MFRFYSLLNSRKLVTRKFNWISSVDSSNHSSLKELDEKMNQYYTSIKIREKYNSHLLEGNDSISNTDEFSLAFLKWISDQQFSNILEIGSGTGRIRKLLDKTASFNSYTGTEVSGEVIAANKMAYR